MARRLDSRYLYAMRKWAFWHPENRELEKQRGYAICTAARSGSNWLCYLLSSTGHLGHPREYFNCEARRQFDDPTYPAEPAGQFSRILTMGATPNRVYGLKVSPSQHDAISQSCAWTRLLPNLNFVWLQRRDVLGQALSAARAVQTGQFRSTVPASHPPTYDPHLIKESLVGAVRDQARWALFFARTGIVPLPVFYEDVVANPQATIDRIAELVGIRQQVVIRPDLIDLRVQRDATTEEWRARFLREEGSGDLVDPL
jgi:LPS sulfotransferase NodH